MTLSVEEYPDEADSKLNRLIKSSDWEAARGMLNTEEGGKMTRMADKYGNLPLHFCLGYRAPDDIILSTLSHYPDATRMHGTDYWLPLHIAAMWGSSPRVMEEIIKCYPQGLDDTGEPGIKGRTPRHFATDRFTQNKPLLERSTAEWIKLIELNK